MTVYVTPDRLAALKDLRARVDAEIRHAEKILGKRHRPAGRGVAQPAPNVSTNQIRAWLRDQGIPVGTNGRISDTYRELYAEAHRDAS